MSGKKHSICFHPHARDRMAERGATLAEVRATVGKGERFVAKFGRTGFRRNFKFTSVWNAVSYETKQIEAYGVEEGRVFMVITVLVQYF